MEENILQITDQLLQALEEGRERFFASEKPVIDRAFFFQMREQADPVFSLVDEWTEKMLVLIADGKMSLLHPQQIEATKENMESFILHSFYLDTRKRKFIEIYKSCYYIFIQCKKELA